MKFRLLSSKHYRKVGDKMTSYKKGDIIESDSDLVSIYGGSKFQRVSDSEESSDPDETNAAAVKEDTAKPSKGSKKVTKVTKTPKEEQSTDRGTDVTVDFENAENYLDLKVFQIGTGRKAVFNVYSGDELCNTEPMSRKEVQSFLTEYDE